MKAVVPRRFPSCRSASCGSIDSSLDYPSSTCHSPIGCKDRWTFPPSRRSLVEMVRRHESLRTAFTWRDELPVASHYPGGSISNHLSSWMILAARASAENSRAKTLLVKMAELEAERECLKPIDAEHAPLFRARLFRLGVNDHVLLLIVHDIVIDGWSMDVFRVELSELYAAFATDRQPQLPEPALQFSDFARWQRRWSTSGRGDPTARLLEAMPEQGLAFVWRREW